MSTSRNNTLVTPTERLPAAMVLADLAFCYTQTQAELYRAKTGVARADIRQAHTRMPQEVIYRRFAGEPDQPDM